MGAGLGTSLGLPFEGVNFLLVIALEARSCVQERMGVVKEFCLAGLPLCVGLQGVI